MESSGEARIGLRVSESMVAEVDKLAAVQGASRSECMRGLIAEGLLRRSEGAYVPLVAQAVRREMDALEERIAARFAAVEDSLDQVGRESREADGESLRMLAVLLWCSSFDGHRAKDRQRLMALLRAAGLDELVARSAEGANSCGK